MQNRPYEAEIRGRFPISVKQRWRSSLSFSLLKLESYWTDANELSRGLWSVISVPRRRQQSPGPWYIHSSVQCPDQVSQTHTNIKLTLYNIDIVAIPPSWSWFDSRYSLLNYQRLRVTKQLGRSGRSNFIRAQVESSAGSWKIYSCHQSWSISGSECFISQCADQNRGTG